MEVVPSDDVAPAGEHLRVPSPGESVGNAQVRAAVKEEVERVLLRAVEAGRISDPHLDLLAVRTLVSDALVFRQFDAGEQRIVEGGKLGSRAGREVEAHERGRLGETLSQRHGGAPILRDRDAGEAVL